MKTLRRRYLVIAIECSKEVSERDFIDAVWGSISRLYGEHGASRVNLSLIEYGTERKLATIRVSHTSVPAVRAALATITSITGTPAAIHVLTISGTLKTLRGKRRDRRTHTPT